MQHFISYSAADGAEFALKLADALTTGTPTIPVWLDKQRLEPGCDWDTELARAICACASLLFVLTRDSVEDASNCKLEWTHALKYKKPITPLLFHRDAELPFRLGARQAIDFTGDFEAGLVKLRCHLEWLRSPAGALQALHDRLADARRDLRRAAEEDRPRIQDEIEQLTRQIAEQEGVTADPEAAARRVEQSIADGLERERQPAHPAVSKAAAKFINPPPAIAPGYYQNRGVETRLIADFLRDDSCRLMTIVGRAGVGKTALACRLLKALELGQLPDDLGPLVPDGIVYLSATGMRRINVPNLYADLCKLLPDATAARLDAVYRNPQASTEAIMTALLAEFPGRTQGGQPQEGPPQGIAPTTGIVVLLDNFEDAVDPVTQTIHDPELDEALRTLLNAGHHVVKVIMTTRVAPRGLALIQPGRQCRLDLDEGLASPYAENILREMDRDGKVGLRAAPADLLERARQRTRGYPRALEALFAILSADRYTTLEEIIGVGEPSPLPENVVEALVGQAFNRLDPGDQRVMQALAVYGRPVAAAAVDYLLQPHLPGLDSSAVLGRLVNMHFARREAGKYHLHPVDRTYAFGRIPAEAEGQPFYTQAALLSRAADYFRQARKPVADWKTLDDLAPQLAEFDLRCAAGEYDTAGGVLVEIDHDYLLLWGHFRLTAERHERLQGKLTGPALRQKSLGNLGNCYFYMGQSQRAIACYEQALALAREAKNRRSEGVWLGNLGSCYGQLGQTARAGEYIELALPVDRETGNRDGEGWKLGNLGNCYAYLGQSARAIECYEQALAIRREVGNRKGEGYDLVNLAAVLIDAGRYADVIRTAEESIGIGEELGNPVLGSAYSSSLALAFLCAGDLPAARAAAEAARGYDAPECNHSALALLGVIALRQGDRPAAEEAFTAATAAADAILGQTPGYFDALDARGLACCGLALCDVVGAGLAPALAPAQGADTRAGARPAPTHMDAAVSAYRAARAVNRDAGIVARVQQLLDALAAAHPEGAAILAPARAAAAGEGR